ncbi:MAG: putative toxin-antitoxin system toxin component, PIN family [Chloroflexota bacterium]|nr:putative toxin-antitoxin system toxin component, PIN family [Chloroflexota bacterium]
MRSSVPRAVLDTNVLVSALISPGGGSARLLLELRSGAFELIVSPLLLAELRDVLRRDKFRRYVSEAEADAYVELIRSEAVVRADPGPSPEPLSPDPDDEYLIDLARDAGADALVTGDAHLLELRAVIPVMTPAEFLETLPGR